jgi:hypothetical protein
MSVFNLGPAISAARAIATQRQQNLKVSHAQEILASLFGCKTYAALTSSERASPPHSRLSAAEHFILNLDWGEARCRELKLPEILAHCCFLGAQDAFTVEANPNFTPVRNVYAGLDEFWEDAGRDELVWRIQNDDQYSGVLNENAHVQFLPEGFDLDHVSENFWQARTEWIVHSRGVMEGDLTDEDGPVFQVEDIGFMAQLTYRKAGRAGLVLVDVELTEAKAPERS